MNGFDASRMQSLVKNSLSKLPTANQMYRAMLKLNTGSMITDEEALEVFLPFPGGEKL